MKIKDSGISRKLSLFLTIIIITITLPFISQAVAAPLRTFASYVINGEKVNVMISKSPGPLDLEGRLKERSVYYFLKLKYMGNFFSLNVYEDLFEKMTGSRREDLVRNVLSLYYGAFNVFYDIFGYIPKGYKFNLTFGKTKKGEPFNQIYLYDKISNIFPDFLPFYKNKEAFTKDQKIILLHEIGHALFGIAVGNLRDPRYKSIEEGFVDYFSEKVSGIKIIRLNSSRRFKISFSQAARMEGISQLDIEKSVWPEETFNADWNADGYAGRTHHLFGIEFIRTFVEVFGEKDLPGFLLRVRQVEDMPSAGELGSKQIFTILNNMGYSKDEIAEFEEQLHNRLKKKIFNITGK